MRLIAAACGGFLIAVLWMDLMFDSQVLRHRDADELPQSVLTSIADYYHRATTASRPMSYVIAAVMLVLLGALGFHAIHGDDPGWLIGASAVLAGVPILLALTRTVSNAVALGNRAGDLTEQSRLARSICRDHLVCVTFMSAFVVLWIAAATTGIR